MNPRLWVYTASGNIGVELNVAQCNRHEAVLAIGFIAFAITLLAAATVQLHVTAGMN